MKLKQPDTSEGGGVSTKRFYRLPYPKDENGKPLCRWCRGPVERPRLTFCSNKCVEEAKLRLSGTWVRDMVWERDHGICRTCGVDTVQKRREVLAWDKANRTPLWGELRFRTVDFKQESRLYREAVSQHAEFRKQSVGDWPTAGSRKTFWDADHILEVVNGGGLCGIENYQTLCVPCHKAKTAKLAKDRSEARRREKKEGA